MDSIDSFQLCSKTHKRARVLVGLEWIFGLVGTIVILLTLMFYLSGPNEEVAPLLKYRPYVIGDRNIVDRSPASIERAALYVTLLTISVLVSSTIPISLSVLLALGITQKSVIKCKLWMALHILVFFGCLGIFIAEIVRGRRFHLVIYIAVGIGTAIRLTVMKFIVDFIVMIKEEQKQRFRALNISRFRVLDKI